MSMLSEFHFIRPAWLLALVPLAWVVWRAGRGSAASAWSKWCDRALLPHILLLAEGGDKDAARRAAWPVRLWLAVAGTLALLALAGPAWEKQTVPVFPDKSALVILLSLADEMNVNDVPPSRLAQAKYKIKDLLAQRPEGSVALVVYAGDAFVVSPLTDEAATVESQLAAVDSSIIPPTARGQRAAPALKLAAELLDNAGQETGAVLLVSSGESDIDSAISQAQELRGQGRRLHVMGAGTTAGAPVPGDGSGFVKDSDGSIVFSKRDDASLAKLARAGGGAYLALGADSSDVGSAIAAINAIVTKAGDVAAGKSQEADFWQDKGAWLLLPLLPLVALAFRRGVLFALLLAPGLLLPPPAKAAFWDNMWQTEDQQAAELLEQGREAAAARKFKDNDWKAASHYAAGNYLEVEKLLRGSREVWAMYMRANALAHLEYYEEALGLYEGVLDADPGHRDAKFNRDLVRDKLRQDPAGDDGAQGKDGQQDGEQQQAGEDGGQSGEGQQMMQQSGEGQQAQMMQQQEGGEGEGEQQAGGAGEAGSEDGSGEEGQQYIVPKEESEVASGDEEGQQRMLLQDEGEGEGEKDEDGQTLLSDSDGSDADEGDDSSRTRYMTPTQREQHMAAEIWMQNIKGNDSSFLKHKFKRQHDARRSDR